ncbi:hypothetical protein KJ693_03175 [bacterium]|nr:hypothetical protein [bacterium]MBU1614293.1 hypothetical protein [bacterium]
MKSLFSLIIGIAVVLSSPLSGFTEIEKRLADGELMSICESVEGTRVKRGKAIGIIDAPPHIVWEVITDNNHFKEFMPRTLESLVVNKDLMPLILKKRPKSTEKVERIIGNPVDPRIYQVKGGTYSIYFYSLLDFPWPISNKWYIIKIDRDETRVADGIYQSSWDMVIGNLRTNQGSWLLEPYGKSQTKATYSLLTDPGGCIPDSFINMGTEKTMPDVIRAVRGRARKLMRQGQLGPVITR